MLQTGRRTEEEGLRALALSYILRAPPFEALLDLCDRKGVTDHRGVRGGQRREETNEREIEGTVAFFTTVVGMQDTCCNGGTLSL